MSNGSQEEAAPPHVFADHSSSRPIGAHTIPHATAAADELIRAERNEESETLHYQPMGECRNNV
eukprot:2276259-Amphidinium_carterae.1